MAPLEKQVKTNVSPYTQLAETRRQLVPLTEYEIRFLTKLRPSHQDVLTASGTLKERAAQLDLGLSTVKSRLNRARRALARAAKHSD